MKKSVEDIKIYRTYLDLISYIEMITEKYPKDAKYGFVNKVKKDLYIGMENIFNAYKVYEKEQKLKYLGIVDVKLKMLKLYARVSYKKKYINKKNYEAWSRKINNVCISLGTWINICLKQ